MSDTRLFLVRHAEVEVRYQKVFGGRIDMELSPLGQKQAAALADYLRSKKLEAIYASPMKRVQQTLAPLLGNGRPSPVILPDLREVNFGDWTGHAWNAVHEKFGAHAHEWLHHLDSGTVPNGETGAAFRERVHGCVREILARSSGQNVLVACHGGVVRMILAILLELPLRRMNVFDIEYASVTELVVLPHRTEIRLLNFTPWRDLAP